MKDTSFTVAYVVLADQRRSRHTPDAVPTALDDLADLPADAVLLGFERTAGDEIQGLLVSADAVVAAVRSLVRRGQWRIGVGIGAVDTPLPRSTRAARGPVYLAARAALEAARAPAAGVALRVSSPATAAEDPQSAGWQAESALLLWTHLLSRRSTEGWEICDLLERGLPNRAAAAELAISPSAASQRASRAAYVEGRRGAVLVSRLLVRAAEEADR